MQKVLQLPVSVNNFVPHALPMLLVKTIEHVEAERAVVSACLPMDCPFASADGVLDQVIYAELVAQAYAAFKGYEFALSKRPVQEGYLVGIRKMEVFGEAVAGMELTVTVHTVGELDGFAVVDGSVSSHFTELAHVRLKLFVPPDGERI